MALQLLLVYAVDDEGQLLQGQQGEAEHLRLYHKVFHHIDMRLSFFLFDRPAPTPARHQQFDLDGKGARRVSLPSLGFLRLSEQKLTVFNTVTDRFNALLPHQRLNLRVLLLKEALEGAQVAPALLDYAENRKLELFEIREKASVDRLSHYLDSYVAFSR